jgi:hypothetical protein
MGMRIYGICTIEEPDSSGEVFNVAGCDLTPLNETIIPLKKSFDRTDFDNIVGIVMAAKQVLKEDDCLYNWERDLFNQVGQTPIVVIQAKIIDNFFADLVRYGVPCYFTVGKKVLERKGNRLEKTILSDMALTLTPAHRAYRVRFDGDDVNNFSEVD